MALSFRVEPDDIDPFQFEGLSWPGASQTTLGILGIITRKMADVSLDRSCSLAAPSKGHIEFAGLLKNSF